MILVIGGAFQGKKDFVKNKLLIKKENIFFDFQDKIKDILHKNSNIDEFIQNLLNDDNINAIICNEIGCGIVPVEKKDRIWREETGRALCKLAEKAESVYRVNCGIGIKIK